jgi:hypothetical protein
MTLRKVLFVTPTVTEFTLGLALGKDFSWTLTVLHTNQGPWSCLEAPRQGRSSLDEKLPICNSSKDHFKLCVYCFNCQRTENIL